MVWGKKSAIPGSPQIEIAEAPSIGSLLKRLVEQTGELFRAELKLAKAELAASVGRAVTPLALLMTGAVLMLGALFTLLAAFVAWLTPLVGPGWAAFIVAVGAALAGIALMAVGGKKLGKTGFAPSRVAAGLKADLNAYKGNQP